MGKVKKGEPAGDPPANGLGVSTAGPELARRRGAVADYELLIVSVLEQSRV